MKIRVCEDQSQQIGKKLKVTESGDGNDSDFLLPPLDIRKRYKMSDVYDTVISDNSPIVMVIFNGNSHQLGNSL